MDIQQLRADYILGNLLKHRPSLNLDLQSLSVFILPLLLFFILVLIVRRILLIKSFLKEEAVLLEITPPVFTEKTAYTTQQLFSVIHNLGGKETFLDRLLGRKTTFSFEITSTLNKGIRYMVRAAPEQANNVKRDLRSYLPHVSVKEVGEYLPDYLEKINNLHTKVVEYKLKRHFAYPLQRQDILKEHDPVAYITGNMTQLAAGELISFQIILSPTQTNEVNTIKAKILQGEDVFAYLNQINIPAFLHILKLPLKLFVSLLHAVFSVFQTVFNDFNNVRTPDWRAQEQYAQPKKVRILNTFQQEVVKSIEEKIDQPLFETKIRLLVVVKDRKDLSERISGFTSSLAVFSVSTYQSLHKNLNLNIGILKEIMFFGFRKRLLSLPSNSSPYLLSASEISDLYHFPFARVTQTEDIVKIHSRQLPAPLSLKRAQDLGITFANNNYGGSTTSIGLTEEERRRHMYILGATGTGKSTLLLSMINQDIQNGKGVCVIDPHGDLVEKILSIIPQDRTEDVIYFNPDDIGFPVGLNLLELSKNLSEEDSLREKELIAESIVSLFEKLYNEKYSGPRMQYILRNTIHTAFTTENPTLFTVYKLLINTKYRKSVTRMLADENLKDFWEYEFSKAGDYQKVKMISPITNKIGRFLFSATAKRILEQEKSTIDFDNILDSSKILLCNLSKGRIGEDSSEVFGILVMTKVQLAALKRARVDINKRRDFYLYVDEFQNFATPSFAQILSEARKYRLGAILAHQTVSQLKDRDLVHITLANTGTVICFRTANPEDERLILPLFTPYIQQGEIANLPSFNFYMKINAINPEEPFSGETVPVNIRADKKKVDLIIEASRKHYAKPVIGTKKAFKKTEKTIKKAVNTAQESISNYV